VIARQKDLAPRRRLTAGLLLILAGTPLGLLMPRAVAQVPPGVMTGETLESQALAARIVGTCDPTGTSTFTFDISGVAAGPYPGTFIESGSFTIGPFTPESGGEVQSFSASFTVYDPSGQLSVRGSKSFVANPDAFAFGGCQTNGNGDTFTQINVVFADYTATVYDPVTAQPVGTDAGRTDPQFNGATNPQPCDCTGSNFSEQFVSDQTELTPVPSSEECKPGYGNGDKNHCHSGPPGHKPPG
jgi:hypothetical protein